MLSYDTNINKAFLLLIKFIFTLQRKNWGVDIGKQSLPSTELSISLVTRMTYFLENNSLQFNTETLRKDAVLM